MLGSKRRKWCVLQNGADPAEFTASFFFFSVKLPVWGLILTAPHMKWEKQSELFLRDRPEAFPFHFASSSAASCFSVHQKLVPCPCKVWQGRIVPLQTLQRRVAQASPPLLCRGTAFLQSLLHWQCSRKYTVQPTLGLQSKAPPTFTPRNLCLYCVLKCVLRIL